MKCGECRCWEDGYCNNPLSVYCGEEMSPEAEPCREFLSIDKAEKEGKQHA